MARSETGRAMSSKPSTVRGDELSLESHLLDHFGSSRLGDVSRVDVQDFADRLLAHGLDPSTIRNTLMPLRAIYRRALSRGEVAINPTTGLTLAAVRGRRGRIASREEAAALIVALPVEERSVWATAFYAGLRRGELRASTGRTSISARARSTSHVPTTRGHGASSLPRAVPGAAGFPSPPCFAST